MIVIQRKRGRGRTTKLVELALQTGAYLVILSQNEISRIRRTFERVPKMITFNEFRNRDYFAKGINGFVIDNVDILLQSITPVSIIGISLNED